MKPSIKLISVVIIGIVVTLLGIAVPATSQPGFCQSCHEMKDDYRAWQASAHKDVNCASCHIEPGAGNFLRHKIAALKEVAAHITNDYDAPINISSMLSEELPPARCIQCHKSPGKKSNGRVIFDHNKHKKAGFNCAYCHNRIAHPGLNDYTSRISMNLCVDCHKKQGGPFTCDTCHPAGFRLAPTSHTKETWAKGHGKGDLSGCSNCHFNTDDFCKDCHGLSMPHPASWIGTHGENEYLLNLCKNCHDKKTFCTRCHELK
jgi:nitrate/TMAO reductase-like tetraheme cytochrome c subunit